MSDFWTFPRRFIAILFVLLLTSPAFGQDQKKNVGKLTLADSVVLALQNNLDVKNAFLDRIVQKFNLKVEENKFYPQSSIALSSKLNSNYSTNGRDTGANQSNSYTASLLVPTGGTFSFTWDYSAAKTDFGQDTVYNPSWNLSFVQPLLKGGGIEGEGIKVATASLRIARINEEMNVLGLKSTLTNIVNSTIQAYRSYIQSLRQLEISKRSLAMAKKLYEINKALVEAGRMAEVEIVQTEADIANRELGILQAENSLQSARLALIQILNMERETLFEPIEETEARVIPPSFEGALKIALNNRPDYLQVLKEVEVSRLNFVVAKRNRLWDLSLEGGTKRNLSGSSYGSTLESAGRLGKTDWNVGVRLTIPFRDLTIEQAYVSAKVAMEKSDLNLKKLGINIGIEVQNAIRDVEIKFKQMQLAKQATTLVQKKLEIEEEKLKVGRTTNFQLLSFQSDLVNAQVSELGAIIDYLNSLTNLDQILGTTLMTWKIEVKREDEEVKLPNSEKKVAR
ncbi:MAG: TolC family protein [Deltaproteobacteria bacterium]|nr:TolC family protein [Deltaproteobacteria bacterium]